MVTINVLRKIPLVKQMEKFVYIVSIITYKKKINFPNFMKIIIKSEHWILVLLTLLHNLPALYQTDNYWNSISQVCTELKNWQLSTVYQWRKYKLNCNDTMVLFDFYFKIQVVHLNFNKILLLFPHSSVK